MSEVPLMPPLQRPLAVAEVMLSKGFGGAERSFVDTCLALAERGHRVLAVCETRFERRGDLEAADGVAVRAVRCRGRWDRWCTRSIRRAVADFGADVTHSHLARAAWMAGVALRGAGVPLVCKMHNYAKLANYAAVDHFIGTTPDQRRYLREAGIADDRISVIPNFSRVPAAASPREPQDGPLRLITLGRLHEVKGHDVLLRALRLAVDGGADVRLTVGGDGDEAAPLRRLCGELGLADRVEFAGRQTDASAFLDGGDVFVLPSRSESFGIALLEAMARGLPVVSTRTKGPWQILGEDGAWWADCEDPASLAAAIVAAAADPGGRRRRAARSLEVFRTRYSEAAVVDRLVDLFRAIRGDAAAPRAAA